jgi:hypothetical protein
MLSRRELLAGLGTLAATAGVTVQTVEPEPLPLLLVLRVDYPFSRETAEAIRAEWDRMTSGCQNLPPLIILDNRATLEAVVAPQGESVLTPDVTTRAEFYETMRAQGELNRRMLCRLERIEGMS